MSNKTAKNTYNYLFNEKGTLYMKSLTVHDNAYWVVSRLQRVVAKLLVICGLNKVDEALKCK